MKTNKNKRITLDTLAVSIEILADRMDKGFEKSDKRTNSKMESLARMVKDNFDDFSKEIKMDMDNKFVRIDDRFRETQEEINDLGKYLEKIGKTSFEDSDFFAEEITTLKKKTRIFDRRRAKIELKTLTS